MREVRGRGRGPRGGLTRKSCYFYEDEAAALADAADRARASEAEIIRRAVRKYLRLIRGES
jgi:hypothetical protein